MDEWTSADTGVGAAMAAGNHEENGICALFVIAARIIVIIINELTGVSIIWIIDHWAWFKVQPILRRRAASPIRFLRAVIIPAARDFGFW